MMTVLNLGHHNRRLISISMREDPGRHVTPRFEKGLRRLIERVLPNLWSILSKVTA